MLSMTIKMNELNGNEKFSRLTATLPANASNPGTIQNGDLMFCGAHTIVLFYKTFPTTCRYTKPGHIDDPARPTAAVRSGNVTVTYDME